MKRILLLVVLAMAATGALQQTQAYDPIPSCKPCPR
jgi:hypothetical protein